MLPQLPSPRSSYPREATKRSPVTSVSFLPDLGNTTPRSSQKQATPSKSMLSSLPTLNLDVNIADLDDKTLFHLATAAKQANESHVAAEAAAANAAAKKAAETSIASSRTIHELVLDHDISSFLDRMSEMVSLSECVALQKQLLSRQTQFEQKYEVLSQYFCSLNGKPRVDLHSSQTKRIEQVVQELDMLSYKLDACAAQILIVESREDAKAKEDIDDNVEKDADMLAYELQQERLRKAGGELFESVLKYPLPLHEIQPRNKNELVLPLLMRAATMSSSGIEGSDAMAQWLFCEFLDDHTVSEILRQVPESCLLSAAKRVVMTLCSTFLSPTAVVLGSTPSRFHQERTLPDFTKIVLHAVAKGAMDLFAMFVDAPCCKLDKALLDAEMMAIILFGAVKCGFVETLRRLLDMGFAHSHLLHAMLFMMPHTDALTIERALSVKAAGELGPLNLQAQATALRNERKFHHSNSNGDHSGGTGNSLPEWEEEPVDVDALLAQWNDASVTISSAGGYTDVPLDRTFSLRCSQKPSRRPVSFTQLVESGRLNSVNDCLTAQAIPYYDTDCVKRFGKKSFAALTSSNHVSVRGDVPVILQQDDIVNSTENRTSFPFSNTAGTCFYYEAHVSLDALSSGEDCVHVGWCDEHHIANGVFPNILGNDDHSLGISLVAYDTADRALHCSSVVPSSSAASVLLRGDTSASAMRAKSRTDGTTSRFSTTGNVVTVAVKHFSGHSQRQFAEAQLSVQVPIATMFSVNENREHSVASSTTTLQQEELFGNAILTRYDPEEERGFDSPVESNRLSAEFPTAKQHQQQLRQINSLGADCIPNLLAELTDSSEAIHGQVVVIGCLVDVSSKSTVFFVNGVSLGRSFDYFPTGANLLFPCASLIRFREDVTSPTVRFCFDLSELRYLPHFPDDGPVNIGITSSISVEGASSSLLWSSTSRDAEKILDPHNRLQLFDQENKVAYVVWMLEHNVAAAANQATCPVMPSGGEGNEPSSPSVVGGDPKGSSVAADKCLNKRCMDQRMYFKPIALINESVELGADHQDLDLAVLCCAANPTPLLFALLQRRRRVAFALAKASNVVVEAPDSFGVTPLHVASALGYCDVVEQILRRCALQQLASSFRGYTPLHSAIMGEHEATVKLLVETASRILVPEDARAMINGITPRGNTPLLLACKLKFKSAVECLLAHGADATIVEKRTNATPLLIACHSGCEDIAELLLRSGQYDNHPSINALSKDNLAVPLCWAAQKGMSKLIPLFAAAGADPNIRFADATPLISAIVCGHEATALAMIEAYLGHVDATVLRYSTLDAYGHLHRRHPFAQNMEGGESNSNNKTHHAALNKQIQTAIGNKFDIHAVDPRSQSTALHLACEVDMRDVVEALIEYGGMICSVNKQFATPMHVAISHGHQELALLLLKEGKSMVQEGISAFDITLMDAKGDTVIHSAARVGMLEVIQRAFELFSNQEIEMIVSKTKNPRLKPLDPLAENRQGDTIFAVAIKSEQPAIAEFLVTNIDSNVDLGGSTTSNNSSAVMECLSREYFKIARLLVHRGAPVSADVRASIERKWEAMTDNQSSPSKPFKAASSVNSTLAFSDEASMSTKKPSFHFSVDGPSPRRISDELSKGGASRTPKSPSNSQMGRMKSMGQLVASRLQDSQKESVRQTMRRRSTIQRMFRPVAARFDETVANSLLQVFQLDELVFEFESIMGFTTLTAPEVLERGEVITSCLLVHSGLCFSASESGVLAKAGYAYLQSQATTSGLLERKDIAKRFHPFAGKVFQIIRRYGSHQGSQALDALQKALDVYRVYVAKQASGSPTRNTLSEGLIGGDNLVNPFSGVTALQLAVSLGLTEVVDFLIRNLAVDPTHRGELMHNNGVWKPQISQLFPLRIAILTRHPDVVSLLVRSNRCDPDAMEPVNVWPCRDTMLHSAARIPSATMLHALLDAGAHSLGVANDEGDDVWLLAVKDTTSTVLDALLIAKCVPDPSFLSKNSAPTSSLHPTARKNDDSLRFPYFPRLTNGDASEHPSSETSSISARNVEYFRRWFNAPFLEEEFFMPDADRNGGSSVTFIEQSLTLTSTAFLATKRTYEDAYYCALLFTCIQHNPNRVLDLVMTMPITVHAVHPLTNDTLLTFTIAAAAQLPVNSRDRRDILQLASHLIVDTSNGINLSSVRLDGETALSLAARLGDMDLIELLLQHGAPIQIKQAPTAGQSQRPKVSIWRLLAHLFYPLERNSIIDSILKALDSSPQTRKAFLASVLPNVHPLMVLRISAALPLDVVAVCSANQPTAADAALSLWMMVMYVIGFVPDRLRSEFFLQKKLMDNVFVPLFNSASAVVTIALNFLKNRQKIVRENQQITRRRQSSTRKPSVSSPMQNPRKSVAAGNLASPGLPLPLPPSGTSRSIRRVSVLDYGESETLFSHSAAVDGSLTPQPVSIELGDEQIVQLTKTPDDSALINFGNHAPAESDEPSKSVGERSVSAPLNLVVTPAGLSLNLGGEAPEISSTQLSSPTPQKGISIELLVFRLNEHLQAAVREGGSRDAAEIIANSSNSTINNASASNTSATASTVTPAVEITPLDRILDLLEVSTRIHCSACWDQFFKMIPTSVKFQNFVKERHLLAAATAACNVSVMAMIMQTQADVMHLDEVSIDSKCPTGVQPPQSIGPSPQVFQRDVLMSAFRNSPKRPLDATSPQSERKVRTQPFRYSVDQSARQMQLMNLSKRLSYDAASAVKTAQISTSSAHGTAAVLPGALAPKPPTTKKQAQRPDPVVQLPQKFPLCLFDWAIHSHYMLGRKAPKKSTLDMICFLADRRCPPTYPLLIFLLSKPDESSQTATFKLDSDVEYNWSSSSGHEVSINSLSYSHEDSWLHLLVMHDLVIIADFFLTVTKGKFTHKLRRNRSCLLPADYCVSYAMAMVLNQHQCLPLGTSQRIAGLSRSSPHSASQKGQKRSASPDQSTHDLVQLLIVPKGFFHLLDSDNAHIDRRLRVPNVSNIRRSLSFVAASSEGMDEMDAAKFLQMRDSGNINNDYLAKSETASQATVAAKSGQLMSRVSDETILRNQRVSQRILLDVFLPHVLYDDPRKRTVSPTNVPDDTSMWEDVGSALVSPNVLSPTNRTPRARPFPIFAGETSLDFHSRSKSMSVSQYAEIPQPISLRLMEQMPSHLHPVTAAVFEGDKSPSTKVASKPRKVAQQKLRSLPEIVDTLQQNLFFVYVSDINNTSTMPVMNNLNSTSSTAEAKVTDKAMFVSMSMYQFALKLGVLRLQNHRVAPYDQLDNAVQTCVGLLHPNERSKWLESLLTELVGTAIASLGLELSPKYL